MKVDQYGVILGCPRSGTSFLGHSLRALPHSEILFAYHLPVTVPHLLNRPVPREVREALAYGFRHLLENYLDSLHNSVLATGKRWAQGMGSFGEVFEAWQQRRTVQWLIYKEPFLAFAPEFAWESFPGVRLIHIVRDGRDCADSLVRTYDVLTDESLATLENPPAPLGRKVGDCFVPWWVEAGREGEFPFRDTVRARRVDVERNDATLPSVRFRQRYQGHGPCIRGEVRRTGQSSGRRRPAHREVFGCGMERAAGKTVPQSSLQLRRHPQTTRPERNCGSHPCCGRGTGALRISVTKLDH
jgi:hypothetical protein